MNATKGWKTGKPPRDIHIQLLGINEYGDAYVYRWNQDSNLWYVYDSEYFYEEDPIIWAIINMPNIL